MCSTAAARLGMRLRPCSNRTVSRGMKFGNSLSVDGVRAVVGAHRYNLPLGFQTGTAYVFKVQQNGQWELEQQLLPSDPVASGVFGRSVALHAGKILVGSPAAETGGVRTGAAYQFGRQGGSWIQLAKYSASDAEANSDFGGAVALGANVFVAAKYDDNTYGFDGGSAYIYVPCP